jgi:putative tributyrin esterase
VGAHQGMGYDDGVARMRRLLDQMSAEVAVLEPPVTAGDGSASTEVTAVPVAEEGPPASPPRWTWRRPHPWVRSVLSGVGAGLLSALVWKLFGAGVQGWAVGLGMDDERGALMAALLITGGAAAAVVAAGGGVRAARLGGVLAFLAIQVGPFLVRGSRTVTTEGLTAHIRLRGWILQPLGMLLLAVLVVSIGAALGQVVRSDLAGLVRTVRRRRGGWAGPAALLVLAAIAAGPAMTAVQDGPISALYDYSSAGSGGAHGPELASGGVALPGTQGVTGVRAGAADSLPGRERPGHIESLPVDGRPSLVYVPGDYAAEPARDFPVIYFLHGYPGNEDQWIGDGAQLPHILDQLIASGELPPVIAVMPNGNGQQLSDAEWGDSQRGDRVEDWLVGRAVPEVDRRYRTLGTGFRAVAGLSSGGFGAINLALRHPDVFRWAASYSGFFAGRRDIFGPATPANSPILVAPHVPQVARMPLFLGAGDSDRVFLAQQAAFVHTLLGVGWQPVHEDIVAGGHGWEAWRLEMVHSLQWLGGLWGSDPETPLCRASCDG